MTSENYADLWDSMVIKDIPEVITAAQLILKGIDQYKAVVEGTEIPWQFIGITHYREGSCSFKTHPHNGDSLQHRTVNVPAGRIPSIEPPYTWEQSAKDCYLTLKGLDKVHEWPLVTILARLEAFNGLGYQKYHPGVNSPYLWSFTNHYEKGKYASDGKFDPELIDKQVGAAPLFRYLSDKTLGLV